MTYRDGARNTSITSATLHPRFLRLRLLSLDESLKLQLKVKALALEAQSRVKKSVREAQGRGAKTSAGVREKKSLVSALLGSDS